MAVLNKNFLRAPPAKNRGAKKIGEPMRHWFGGPRAWNEALCGGSLVAFVFDCADEGGVVPDLERVALLWGEFADPKKSARSYRWAGSRGRLRSLAAMLNSTDLERRG